jgi:hypothetical protein
MKHIDFNGCPIIPKGTLVTIKTTNGGEITARLLENHRFTYDAVIESGNDCAIINCWRIASIHIAN